MSLLAEYTKSTGNDQNRSVAKMEYVFINNSRQFVLVRSRNIDNPVLLFIHGGPGASETAFFRHYNELLESEYTVIYWDQRQCGKSYSFLKKEKKLTINQYADDLVELIKWAVGRYNREKVAIIGHSWGTVPGTLAAARHPGLISCYIGTGQVSRMAESEKESYDYVLSMARKENNIRAIEELNTLGSPVNGRYGVGYRGTRIQRKWLVKYKGAFYNDDFMKKLLRIYLGTPEYNIFSIIKVLLSMNDRARNAMVYDEFLDFNLEKLCSDFTVPVYFFLGRHDHQISSSLAEKYFNNITAPEKGLIWFENSGHAPCFEEPEKFNNEVIKLLNRKKESGL